MALLLEGKEQDIIDIRANGSLSPFYLSYFLGMELSSPFLCKSIKIDKMEVIKTDIEGCSLLSLAFLEMLVAISSRVSANVSLKRR